jgi:hypothetical protein
MSEQRPLSELGAQMWARLGPEMKAELAKAPELTPDQVREIRGIWLGIITRKASR